MARRHDARQRLFGDGRRAEAGAVESGLDGRGRVAGTTTHKSPTRGVETGSGASVAGAGLGCMTARQGEDPGHHGRPAVRAQQGVDRFEVGPVAASLLAERKSDSGPVTAATDRPARGRAPPPASNARPWGGYGWASPQKFRSLPP
jgi:hypothetical protein